MSRDKAREAPPNGAALPFGPKLRDSRPSPFERTLLLPKAKPATPSPLASFGGWSDAAWFSDTLLSDPEVVAFELPKLPGLRKQGFHVIDRTLAKAPGRAPERLPKRMAGKLAVLLDGAGATRAVASCRSRLLFESGPVLFFADIPSARLKPRAASKLRRALVELGVTACVLRVGSALTTLMFWPSAEADITGFVAAAGPEQAIHAAFGGAAEPPARRAAPGTAAQESKLLRQIAALQAQVEALTRAQSALGAMEQLGLDDARLKSMLKLLHPDRHANSEAATEAAKWVNSMRDLLKGKAQ